MSDIEAIDARGLRADHLNSWLAAVGVTALLPEARLSWTNDISPHAILWLPVAADLSADIASAIPPVQWLDHSSIARTHPECTSTFPRKVGLKAFEERAELARRTHDPLLAASVTDLVIDARQKDELPHSPFDTPAPRGETLYSRARSCRATLDDEEIQCEVSDTLNGRGQLQQLNGLGFDATRLSSGVQSSGAGSKVHVFPVVELLALAALRLFPFRGDGEIARQRGWTDRPSRRGAFRWRTWQDRLDVWAIDSLLDLPFPADCQQWQTVPYEPLTAQDVTRAYFSEPAS